VQGKGGYRPSGDTGVVSALNIAILQEVVWPVGTRRKGTG